MAGVLLWDPFLFFCLAYDGSIISSLQLRFDLMRQSTILGEIAGVRDRLGGA